MSKCFTGCPEKAHHTLGWRIRGPKEGSGTKHTHFISGGTANLAHACDTHLAELMARAALIKFEADQTGLEVLDELVKLNVRVGEDMTAAEAKVVLKKAKAAEKNLAAVISAYESRANPTLIK